MHYHGHNKRSLLRSEKKVHKSISFPCQLFKTMHSQITRAYNFVFCPYHTEYECKYLVTVCTLVYRIILQLILFFLEKFQPSSSIRFSSCGLTDFFFELYSAKNAFLHNFIPSYTFFRYTRVRVTIDYRPLTNIWDCQHKPISVSGSFWTTLLSKKMTNFWWTKIPRRNF